MIHVHSGHRLPEGLLSPDIYFAPEYGRAASITEGGEWVLLEGFDGAWQMPVIVRALDNGTKDAITPHFSGVYAAPSLSSGQIQTAWSGTVSALRELGVISVLLRGSPLMPQAPHLLGQQPIVSGHPTIVLEPSGRNGVSNGHQDGTKDGKGDGVSARDSAWNGLAGTCRTRVRKALKNGYTGAVRLASSQDLAPESDFRRLYEKTMRRLDAAPVYFFGDDYYRELLAGLASNLLIVEVRDPGGVPVSSALLMRHAHLLHYHLAGSNVDHVQMGTNNLMLWTAAEFTAEQGLRQFHLGGGNSGKDSLFRFKHTFGGRELEYGISGLVIDEALYQDKVEARAKECDTNADALLTSNYFPAYRGGTQ